jgi:hypothetical protein
MMHGQLSRDKSEPKPSCLIMLGQGFKTIGSLWAGRQEHQTTRWQEAIQPPSGSISGQISESNGQGVLYGPSPLQGPFGVQIINQLQDGV